MQPLYRCEKLSRYHPKEYWPLLYKPDGRFRRESARPQRTRTEAEEYSRGVTAMVKNHRRATAPLPENAIEVSRAEAYATFGAPEEWIDPTIYGDVYP